jgi:hypothetical protein
MVRGVGVDQRDEVIGGQPGEERRLHRVEREVVTAEDDAGTVLVGLMYNPLRLQSARLPLVRPRGRASRCPSEPINA